MCYSILICFPYMGLGDHILYIHVYYSCINMELHVFTHKTLDSHEWFHHIKMLKKPLLLKENGIIACYSDIKSNFNL